eukprot:GHVR01065713.1.p2 GENE.GHVR01065713.1~~GHVR01065713.1.p2  ORF type:complete len:214 (+),score=22.40 GHVR01065713.1:430-1071(+)
MATDLATKREKLNRLKEEYEECNRCPLHRVRERYFTGHGDPDAKLLIVLDKISELDLKTGIILKNSMHGVVLSAALGQVDLELGDVWVTPALLCGEEELKTPKAGQVKACRDRLFKEVHCIKPNVIVCLGTWAVKAVVAKKPPTIASAAGRMVDAYIPGNLVTYAIPAMVTYSPGLLLREQDTTFGGPWHRFFQHIERAAAISEQLERQKCQN